MAHPPTPSTSQTSTAAVVDYRTRPATPHELLTKVHEDERLGPYVYKYAKEEPFMKVIKDEPFMVRRLYKHYLDPYGFTRPIPRQPLPCWFCASADVRPKLDTLTTDES